MKERSPKQAYYRQRYLLRTTGGRTVEVSLPPIVIERAAEEAGQNVELFIKTHKIEHLFDHFSNDFAGAYRFVPIEEDKEKSQVA